MEWGNTRLSSSSPCKHLLSNNLIQDIYQRCGLLCVFRISKFSKETKKGVGTAIFPYLLPHYWVPSHFWDLNGKRISYEHSLHKHKEERKEEHVLPSTQCTSRQLGWREMPPWSTTPHPRQRNGGNNSPLPVVVAEGTAVKCSPSFPSPCSLTFKGSLL